MATTLAPAELRKQIKAYKDELPRYTRYANVLHRIFQEAFPLAVVQARPKAVSSFAEKAVRRRDRYPDPVHMFTDLCGARIIVQTLDQIATIRQFIEANFVVLEFDDKTERLGEEEFGYRDTHYIVQLREDRNLGVSGTDWETIGERKAEVQVRTVLQHAWADILHDRTYKTVISVPTPWRREANRLSAILEKTDESFGRLVDSLDAQTSAYEVFLPADKLSAEIDALKIILELTEEPEQRMRLALKLARVLIVANCWAEAVDVLVENRQDTPDYEVELGYALCCSQRQHRDSRQFRKGIRLLESVAQPNEPAELQDIYSPSTSAASVRPGLRAKALYRLGRVLALYINSCAKALPCFQKAHMLRPDNPYYHVAYVQAKLCLSKESDLLSLTAAGLKVDIDRCRRHVTLGIELPNALFTMARCHLLMGETNACLCAYAKAIDASLCANSCVPFDLLGDEIKAVKEVSKLNELLVSQVLTLLHLAHWRLSLAKGFTAAAAGSRAWLTRRRLRCQFKPPVLVVIGGAELMPRKRIPEYFRQLLEALEFLEGSVISGGTTSGIPGVVGDVTRTLKDQGALLYDLYAYMPKRLPRTIKTHRSYHIAGRTEGTDFSEEELIACWVDILLSGIEPDEIVALGINGGRIADFEYRLALALGAHVGIMKDSGRAASVLLTDPDWRDHPRLRVIPDDPLLIWAFTNRQNSAIFSPDQVEKAAPQAHEFYRQRRLAKDETSDPSTKHWDHLDPGLKQSNREQVRFIGNVLKKAGFIVTAASNPAVIRLGAQEIEEMAKREHARWTMERIREGWVYGDKKDIGRKISPSLKSWNELPASVQEFDREAVSLFPLLLAELGYEIQRQD